MLKVIISKKPFSSYSVGHSESDTEGFRYIVGSKVTSPFVKMVKNFGTDDEVSRIVDVHDWDNATKGFVMIADSFGWFCPHVTVHTLQNRKGIAIIGHEKKRSSTTLLLPSSEKSYKSYLRRTGLEV